MPEIRPEKPEDVESIRQITKAAFEPMEFSSQTEAEILDGLRQAGALSLSLVALSEKEVVGQVTFSPITIEGKDHNWYGLGPVAVRPDRQREGIGSQLIRAGLSRLAAHASGCVVLGAPEYYRRFGFDHDPQLVYSEAPAQYFMRLVFQDPVPAGKVAFHEAFLRTR